MSNTISVYFQVYSNKRAVFECLKSFRSFYPNEEITLISDNGEDFSNIAKTFRLNYTHSDKNILPKGKMESKNGVYEYLNRIYNHCNSTDSDWVLIMEEDVRTLRKIKIFPETDCAGPRLNFYTSELTKELIKMHGEKKYPYGYGLSGGSIFKRQTFLNCYPNYKQLENFSQLDERLFGWSDIPLTLLFQLNGYDYTTWEEVSELTHIYKIDRDAALDHAYKYWYNKEYNDEMLRNINE
jgi:hypothetical protein